MDDWLSVVALEIAVPGTPVLLVIAIERATRGLGPPPRSAAIAIFWLTVTAATVGMEAVANLPWAAKQLLYVDAGLLEGVGVLMVAWPDVAVKVSVYRQSARQRARDRLGAARRAPKRARAHVFIRWRRARLAAVNWYRRRRAFGQHIVIEVQPARLALTPGQVDVRVRRAGTLEERVDGLDDEMARVRGNWRADFADLRDERVAFRAWGLLLVFIGIAVNAAANLTA